MGQLFGENLVLHALVIDVLANSSITINTKGKKMKDSEQEKHYIKETKKTQQTANTKKKGTPSKKTTSKKKTTTNGLLRAAKARCWRPWSYRLIRWSRGPFVPHLQKAQTKAAGSGVGCVALGVLRCWGVVWGFDLRKKLLSKQFLWVAGVLIGSLVLLDRFISIKCFPFRWPRKLSKCHLLIQP